MLLNMAGRQLPASPHVNNTRIAQCKYRGPAQNNIVMNQTYSGQCFVRINAMNGPGPLIYFMRCTPQAARLTTTVTAPPKAMTPYEVLRAADSEIRRVRFQRAWQAR